MSSAHRPTWAPAQAKDASFKTQIYSARDMASHTRLKFRQPGQTSRSDIERRDLKLELLKAEREAEQKKAREGGAGEASVAAGLIEGPAAVTGPQPASEGTAAPPLGPDGDERAKRRGVLEEIAREADSGSEDSAAEDASDSEDSDADDSEDETAMLMRELEKIKRERAEEKAKEAQQEQEQEQISREEEVARGNPLLDLQSALGYSPAPSTAASTSFGVKRRWDDDVIFKNQARDTSDTPRQEFVNDLLRTEFHKRFMKKFIG